MSTLESGRTFNPVILNIKKAPSHAVARSVKQIGITQVRGQKGDEHNTHNWNIGWVDKCSRPFFTSLNKTQKVNHLPGVEQLSKKRNLVRCMAPMMKAEPEAYSFMPRSWSFPHGYKDFVESFHAQRAKEEAARAKGEDVTPMTYIVKPGSACQGRGIYLVQNLEDIKPVNGHVVSEYIADPLLINNKKFDLRIYVAVTSTNPLRVYLYQDGLARFCTEDYVAPKPENLSTLFGHLTNYSLNKMNENFVSADDDAEEGGNDSSKWTLQALNEYLAAKYGHAAVRQIWMDIQHVMMKTIIASTPLMQKAYKTLFPEDHSGGHGFQLFGFDIMLDQKLKPWLIEVNRNPSLRCDSLLDQKIKTFLLDQLFYLLDPVNSTTPSEALVAAVEQATGPLSPESEEKLRQIRNNVQARGELNADELKVFQTRKRCLELQARLEHEDTIISTFLNIAARATLAQRNKDEALSPKIAETKQATVNGKPVLAQITLPEDPTTKLPAFATAWQPLFPLVPLSDYPVPVSPTVTSTLLPYRNILPYNGAALPAALPDEQALHAAGVSPMFPSYTQQSASARMAEYEALLATAYAHLPQWETAAMSEALNNKMGLGGPPTAAWTMGGINGNAPSGGRAVSRAGSVRKQTTL